MRCVFVCLARFPISTFMPAMPSCCACRLFAVGPQSNHQPWRHLFSWETFFSVDGVCVALGLCECYNSSVDVTGTDSLCRTNAIWPAFGWNQTQKRRLNTCNVHLLLVQEHPAARLAVSAWVGEKIMRDCTLSKTLHFPDCRWPESFLCSGVILFVLWKEWFCLRS